MTTTISTSSPIEKLNAAIQSHNPFVERGAIARVNDIWGKGFPDVSTLNAHASEAVFQTIKQVSSSQSKVASLAIIAERGVGKTHLFGRIRHRCQVEGSALFIYASATRFTHSDLIKYQLLQVVSDSLSQVGSQGVKQWQELATALLNTATKTQTLPQEMIEKKFPYALSKNKNLLDNLTGAVLKSKSDCDPDIVRAILWTLSKENASYAIKWLSGNDLSEAKAADLGLPNLDKEEREAKAFETVRQIFSLCSDYKPVIICFDELEAVNIENGGFPRPQAVAELVKNLFDSLYLSNSSRGVIILTVMMPDTWKLKIKNLPGGIPERVSSATPEPIELLHIDSDSIIQLVTIWLKDFYGSKNLVPHLSLYPFTESQLRELGKERPPVRRVLHWCAKNFQVPGTLSNSENNAKLEEIASHPVEVALSKELASVEADIATLMEDKAILADALRLGFQTVIGQTIENVKVERIEEIEPRRDNSGWIDFKIVGKEHGKLIKIGVAVIQQSSANSLLAGLKRLIAYRLFGLTRGCLVRGKEISNKAVQAQEYLNKLLSPKYHGEWVKLASDDIKPLLAIRSVYLRREDHSLIEKQIFDFIAQTSLTAQNYLIREILSSPSGQIPTGLVPEVNGKSTTENETNSSEKKVDVITIDIENNQTRSKLPASDLSWVHKIAEIGNSSDGHTFEKLVRKALIELGFKNSNSRSEASLDPDGTGGAGGLDFYCEEPYLVVGECKATKSEKVPDGTAAQLIKLGYKHLQNNYDRCIKIIVAAGELTTPAQKTAEGNKINIIRPETLQKLVELQVKHKGSVDLLKLKQSLEEEPFGLADNKVNRYIDKIRQHILLRSQVVEAVKDILADPNNEKPTANQVRIHYNATFGKISGCKINSDEATHDLLVELSSPLTGYLGREKGSDWQSDRFYYLRDLIVKE